MLRKHLLLTSAVVLGLNVNISTAIAKNGADDVLNGHHNQEDVIDDHGNHSSSSKLDNSNVEDNSRNKGSSKSMSSNNQKVRLRAKLGLIAESGVMFAESQAHREAEIKKDKANDRFSAKVEIGVPEAVLGLNGTLENAKAASVHAILSRAGIAYADCTLAFDKLETEDDDNGAALLAEYKVDIETRTKKGLSSLRLKKGDCDIDLVTDGSQSGVPAVQDGDTIAIQSGAVLFMNGTFANK